MNSWQQHAVSSEDERTFVMVKPDGVNRKLVGTIIQRFEKKGLRLIGLKYLKASDEDVRKTYCDEVNAAYFPLLMKIMTAGPVAPMVWEGPNAVTFGRKIISELVTEFALPGTIRGDFCLHVGRNVCHAADNPSEALMDIGVWFLELKI